jgi:hypothetical protein
MYLLYDLADEFLFTENETNFQRLYGSKNTSPFVKDAFHTYIVSDDKSATNLDHHGTKVAPVYRIKIAGGDSRVVYLRLVSAADWTRNRMQIANFSTKEKGRPTIFTSNGSAD